LTTSKSTDIEGHASVQRCGRSGRGPGSGVVEVDWIVGDRSQDLALCDRDILGIVFVIEAKSKRVIKVFTNGQIDNGAAADNFTAARHASAAEGGNVAVLLCSLSQET